MSSQFKLLHPYVSQRLLSLFETLAKKHARLEAKIRTMSTVPDSGNSANLELVSFEKKTHNCILIENNFVLIINFFFFQIQDMTILEEVLRMVLEIVNSCLTHCLAENPNFGLRVALQTRDLPAVPHSLVFPGYSAEH